MINKCQVFFMYMILYERATYLKCSCNVMLFLHSIHLTLSLSPRKINLFSTTLLTAGTFKDLTLPKFRSAGSVNLIITWSGVEYFPLIPTRQEIKLILYLTHQMGVGECQNLKNKQNEIA